MQSQFEIGKPLVAVKAQGRAIRLGFQVPDRCGLVCPKNLTQGFVLGGRERFRNLRGPGVVENARPVGYCAPDNLGVYFPSLLRIYRGGVLLVRYKFVKNNRSGG